MSEMMGVPKELFGNALPRPGGAHAMSIRGPKKIRPRHKLVWGLRGCGWTNDEIAKATGYTPARVSVILASRHPELLEVGAEAERRLVDSVVDTQQRLKLYANEMLGIMVHHARDKTDPANSRLAARDILHMAGYSPVKKQLTVGEHVPGEQLIAAAKMIEAANHVVARQGEWEVREVKSA